MFGRRAVGFALCAASLAQLAGCEFEGDANSMPIEMNTCSISSDCAKGSKCSDGLCVADAAEAPLTIALEVTPLQTSDGARQSLPIVVEPFVVSESMDHDFALPTTADVSGLVRNLGMPIDASVTFTPIDVIPGVAPHSVTVAVTPNTGAADADVDDYLVKLLRNVAYRMLVKPLDTTLPPYSQTFTAGKIGFLGTTYDTFKENDELRKETFAVMDGAADRELLVTAIDLHDEPISSTATVAKGKAELVFTPGSEQTPFRIQIRAAQTFDEEPVTDGSGSLCDTDTPAFPVFSIDGSSLTKNTDGDWQIALPKQSERIRYEGTVELCPDEQANAPNVSNLPITLHSKSLLLASDPSVTASFDATTSANYDKATQSLRFCVQVLPGEYDVLATPPSSMACALFAERRLIKPPDEDAKDKDAADQAASGALLTLPRAGYLAGTVQANGPTPLAGASIEASALGQPAAVDLAPDDHSVTRYNRSSETSTTAEGRFKLPVDLGTYDVVVKPPVESGFPWQVRTDVKVGLGARNLPFSTTIDTASPVVVTGSLHYRNGGEDSLARLKGAEVKAFALIDDANGGQRAVAVGRATADEDGNFTLLLPVSTDGTW